MKKIISTITMLGLVCALAGCSSSEPSNSSISNEDIQKMVDDAVEEKSEEIKSNLSNDIDGVIDDKLSSINVLTDDDRDAIKDDILSSIASGNSGSVTSNFVYLTQEGDTYTSNVINNNTNVITSNTPSKDDDTSGSKDPDKIKDGMDVAIKTDLPKTYKINDDYNITITELSVKAYNHKAEPYIETAYPYSLKVSIKGTASRQQESAVDSYHYPAFPIKIVLSPFDTKAGLPFEFLLDGDSSSFSETVDIRVNLVPDSISLDAQQDSYSPDWTGHSTGGNTGNNTGGSTGGNSSNSNSGGGTSSVPEDNG